MQHHKWGGRRVRRNIREREIRIGAYRGRDTKMTRRASKYQTDLLQIRHNVSRNPIGMVPNVPLASDLGKESHPPILITLDMHGGQVKIYGNIQACKYGMYHILHMSQYWSICLSSSIT